MNPQTAKALSEPWRNRILIELHKRPMSPTQFADAFGGPNLGTVARYFRQLRDWGYLEVLEKRPSKSGRSVNETIYRAVSRGPLYLESWESISPDVKSAEPGLFIGALLDQIHQAVLAGTMDADIDRHLSWKSLLLDRQAWRDCRARLSETQAWVKRLEAESAKRQATKNLELIPTTVALMAFRSPGV
jgi:DNA-binding transcriptional ArsR family regulator